MSFSLPFETADAVKIVRDAGRLALSLRGQFKPDIKADQTLVTEADRRVEEMLRENLSRIAPDFAFLGEEGGLTGDPDAPCWVIDPIDGTTNFVRGIPLWCVSVGAVYQGKSIFGCIAVAPHNEIMWATVGQGAWLSSMSNEEFHSDQNAIRMRAFDSTELMQEDLIACNTTAESACDFTNVTCRLRNMGSLAYHLTLMARGALVCSLSRQHKLYDIAAGICLCEEAGCIARYLGGEVWTAQVVAPSEPMPLLVAPPQIMNLLLQKLTLC